MMKISDCIRQLLDGTVEWPEAELVVRHDIVERV